MDNDVFKLLLPENSDNENEIYSNIKNGILDLKNKNCIDNDNIRYKEIIKNVLCNDYRILMLLENKAIESKMLEEGVIDGSLYLEKNIFSRYALPNTIIDVDNFICFEISFEEVPKYNSTDKYGRIEFNILCDLKSINYIGMNRHDLLGYCIIDIFNWSHLFDTQLRLVSDKPSVTDKGWGTRTLVFEFVKPNSILRTSRIENHLESTVINKTKGL